MLAACLSNSDEAQDETRQDRKPRCEFGEHAAQVIIFKRTNNKLDTPVSQEPAWEEGPRKPCPERPDR